MLAHDRNALGAVPEGTEPGDVISVEDVGRALAGAAAEPEPGDAVLFHTGWGAHWDDADTYLSGEPGPGYEVAEWLVDHGVALTGCDTWSYGPVPAENPERPFEVPQHLNVRHGVFVVENLDTATLAADGIREFALVLTHPKLRGATGAWPESRAAVSRARASRSSTLAASSTTRSCLRWRYARTRHVTSQM